MTENDNRKVTCPHCGLIMTIDGHSGEVLLTQKPERREAESFEDAVRQQLDKGSKSDDLFSQALEIERKRKELLEKKFKEAHKSMDAAAPPPLRPLDFD